jgi:hypothetical protein
LYAGRRDERDGRDDHDELPGMLSLYAHRCLLQQTPACT